MANFDPDAYLASKSEPKSFDPDAYLASKSGPKPEMSQLDTIKKVAPNALAFGLGPFAAGVGAGAGSAYETFNQNSKLPIGERLSKSYQAGKEGFLQGREDQNKSIKEAEEANPKTALATEIGSGLIGGVPIAAAKGVRGLILAGGAAGAAKGLSEANTPEELANKTIEGAATGAATHGLMQYGGQALKKGASALTGIPEDIISTYASKTDKINDMIKKAGGDVADMADETKNKIFSAIQDTKSKLGKTIGDSLQSLGDQKTLDVNPVLQAINGVKSKLAVKIKANPSLGKEIDDMSSYVTNLAEDGKVSPLEMHTLKELYQDEAKSSYLKNGQIFSRGKDAQQAAKQAARTARQIVNDAAPDVAQANNKLSELHSIEDKLNKNIIKPGGSDAALGSVGAGTNPVQAKLLRKTGAMTGTNPLESAQEFSAARTFANPGLLPIDTTGKSVLRAGAGYYGGKALGQMTGFSGLEYAGAATTSPFVTKGLINAGNISKNVINEIVPLAIQNQGKLAIQKYISSPQGQAQLQKSIPKGQ